MSCLSTTAHLHCIQCELHQYRTQVVPGHGNPNAKIALILEAPGRDEDVEGRPAIGLAGKRLDEIMQSISMCRVVSSAEGDACISHAAQPPSLSMGDAYDPLIDTPCSTHASSAGPPIPGLVLQLDKAAYQEESDAPVLCLCNSDSQAVADECSSNDALHESCNLPTDHKTTEEVEDRNHLQKSLSESLDDHFSASRVKEIYSHRHRRILLGTQRALSCPYCTTLRVQCNPIFLDNRVQCRPPHNRVRDFPNALVRCPPLWMLPNLAKVNPYVVVAMGATAGDLWFPGLKAGEIASLARNVGDYIVVGSYHPSAALREGAFPNWMDHSIAASLTRSLVYAALKDVRL